MSDFPRGWTLSNRSVGGTASITVPAITGVVHVLDGFDASMVNTSAAFAGLLILLSSSDGTFASFILAELAAAATTGVDTGSGSNLDLAAGPGASLTITFNGGIAGVNETLIVQGHDI